MLLITNVWLINIPIGLASMRLNYVALMVSQIHRRK